MFTTFADFLDKADLPALNKRAVESLIKAGSFDSLHHSRKGLTAIHEEAIDAIIPVKKAASFGQFFPASYQLVRHALAEDNVISVKGKIEDRDGTVNLFGRELAVLDVSRAGHGGKPPVRLNLPFHRITEQSVKELKRILTDHPGDSPVRLSVRGARKTTVYASTSPWTPPPSPPT